MTPTNMNVSVVCRNVNRQHDILATGWIFLWQRRKQLKTQMQKNALIGCVDDMDTVVQAIVSLV